MFASCCFFNQYQLGLSSRQVQDISVVTFVGEGFFCHFNVFMFEIYAQTYSHPRCPHLRVHRIFGKSCVAVYCTVVPCIHAARGKNPQENESVC